MQFLYANNAVSALAYPIGPTDTIADLAPGTGIYFPQPIAGQQFALTFVDQATQLLNEIVYVTNVTGDVITMMRAQEGTASRAWSAGDYARHLLTAGTLLGLANTIANSPALIAAVVLALEANPSLLAGVVNATLASLPTSLPSQPNVPWNNGGQVSVS